MTKTKPCEKFDILPEGGCRCLSQMTKEERQERREEVGKAATEKLNEKKSIQDNKESTI